ncbi:ATP-dependent zinc protease [Pseudohalioglobus sediminis]|uniref:ATP-dependent zinc protease n=1 Tax=Pseudohalioglobus sediminis TaxID=2606449 RepID=A0A5B0X708_9GAMM|nr:ATP-dependent zinc protease [Pseudohalioglobus sediminis]KAA1194019.1 ATP-dependent zinc protease [Pseudohalioglobus sediminis]
MSTDKPVLGWREWLSFPGIGIAAIKAKVDTGARTSCLHAYYVEPFERDGSHWVRFGIHPQQGDTSEEVHCEAPLKDRRVVRDSGGHEELRYVIETEMVIGEHRFTSEVTLTDRDTMKFRVLLGRTGIGEHYLVDPSKSYVQGRRKRKVKRGQRAVKS